MTPRIEKRLSPRITKINGICCSSIIDSEGIGHQWSIDELLLFDISETGAWFCFQNKMSYNQFFKSLPKKASLELDLTNNYTGKSLYISGELIRKGYKDIHPYPGFSIQFDRPINLENILDISNVKQRLILVVDDEEHIRLLHAEEFSEAGYKVITAADGYKLMERIESEKPDLIILDIKMIDYNGLDILQEIRNRFYALPVILNTAYDTYRNDIKAIAADFYVIKSFDLTELKIKVQRAITASLSIQCAIPENSITSIHNLLIDYINLNLNASYLDFDTLVDPFLEIPELSLIIENLRFNNDISYAKKNLLEDFNGFQIIFVKELRKTHKAIRSYLLENGFSIEPDLNLLYRKFDDWIVLSESRFRYEFLTIRMELRMESSWMETKLKEILKQLRHGAINKIPFEELKAVLFSNRPIDINNLGDLDLILADIRHDLVNTIKTIRIKERKREYDFNEQTKVLESLYERMADISGFKVKPSIMIFDIIKFIKKQVSEIGLINRKDLKINICPNRKIDIITDKALLGLAIRHIIRNAAEAIEKTGSIEILVSLETDLLRIQVEDDGIGIPTDIIPKIFDSKFTYLKKNTTGMGLTLAKIAISSLGGEIIVDSQKDKGTKAIITVPGGEYYGNKMPSAGS